MSAQEFYFKQPFEINEEYAIMKSILFLAFFPIEAIFIFAYARIYGSLQAYNLLIIPVMVIVNLILCNVLINNIKDRPFVDETMASYRQSDYGERKKLYSFKNGASVLFLMVLMPWLISIVCIYSVCVLFPHS